MANSIKKTFNIIFHRRNSPKLIQKNNSDKLFNSAFEVFRIEFQRLVHESATELSTSLVNLARSPEFSRTTQPYRLRQKIYQESVEKLGDDFFAALSSIVLPHCEDINDQQIELLQHELQIAINAKLQQAKSGLHRFAASLGRPDDANSMIIPLEGQYQTIALKFRERLFSIIKQANLHNAHTKTIKPSEDKLEKNIFQKCKNYFTNHKVYGVLIFLASVLIALGTLTDALQRLVKLVNQEFSSPIVIIVDVINKDTVNIDVNSLVEFDFDEDIGLRTVTYPGGRTTLHPLSNESLLSDFTIKARTTRSYSLTLPKTDPYNSLLERGSANIVVTISKINSHQYGIGGLIFQKDYIKKYKIQAVINDKE
jgi:hypothetical protein